MIRIATLADGRFRQQAGNLKTSLERSGNDFHLTIYCGQASGFHALRGPRCDLVELAEIRSLGPKRAKLTAFAHALREGSVIYLDADAIVLEDLSGLWNGNVIQGCSDELEYCPFIADTGRPWPLAPELANRCYINSGGFFAPAERFPFFEEIRRASLDDATWRKYSWATLDAEVCRRFNFDGCLEDNHFFCAFLNLCREPVRLLDSTVYGWRGFLKDGQAQVYRSGSRLLNRQSHEPLRVILFAGLQQTPGLLRSVPIEISSLIFERTVAAEATVDGALAQLYAALSPSLAEPLSDPWVSDVLSGLISELSILANRPAPGGPDSYFFRRDAMRAMAHACPPRDYTWNGLPCGGRFLDGPEYLQARKIVRTWGIQTVLEAGAGETAAFFRSLGVRTHSPQDPPDSPPGLILIDAPAELDRLMQQYGRPSFVLYRDSFRDAAHIFREQSRHGLRLAAHLDSPRGLTLFEVPPYRPLRKALDPFDPATLIRQPAVTIRLAQPDPPRLAVGRQTAARVSLANRGRATLSSRYDNPVFLSYHWMNPAGEMIQRGGIRTALPFDLEQGDTVELWAHVMAPENPGEHLLQFAVVQERVCWFEEQDPQSVCTVRVAVGE